MNIRNEIKAQIVRAGMTMQEVVDQLSIDYGWSESVSNLSGKLQRESIRYKEVLELAAVLGYDIVWQKRGERWCKSRSMPSSASPSTRRRKSATLRPTMSAPRRSTPAIPMWTPAGATSTSILFSPNGNTGPKQSGRSPRPSAVSARTAFGWWRRWWRPARNSSRAKRKRKSENSSRKPFVS